jgi:hypothetical protein
MPTPPQRYSSSFPIHRGFTPERLACKECMQYRRRAPDNFRGAAVAMLTVRQIDRADEEWLQKK